MNISSKGSVSVTTRNGTQIIEVTDEAIIDGKVFPAGKYKKVGSKFVGINQTSEQCVQHLAEYNYEEVLELTKRVNPVAYKLITTHRTKYEKQMFYVDSDNNINCTNMLHSMNCFEAQNGLNCNADTCGRSNMNCVACLNCSSCMNCTNCSGLKSALNVTSVGVLHE